MRKHIRRKRRRIAGFRRLFRAHKTKFLAAGILFAVVVGAFLGMSLMAGTRSFQALALGSSAPLIPTQTNTPSQRSELSQGLGVAGLALAATNPAPTPTATFRVPPVLPTKLPATPSAAPPAVPPCSAPTTNQGWPLYSNNQYGYNLKYPSNLIYIEQTRRAADILHSVRFLLEKDKNSPQPNEIDVTVFDNPLMQSTNTWFAVHRQKVEGSAALFENISLEGDCSVDGLPAIRFRETTAGSVHRVLVSRGKLVLSLLVVDYEKSEWLSYFSSVVSMLRLGPTSR